MKPILTFCMATIFTFIACKNENASSAESKAPMNLDTIKKQAVNEVDTILSGCYSMIVNRDTASLQMQVKGNLVTGSLSYNLHGKDRNDGTFEGEINHNILTGWYLFRSEGVMSVRQVAWKVNDTRLLPATGEMVNRNDSALFRDINTLKFDDAHVFKKVNCVI